MSDTIKPELEVCAGDIGSIIAAREGGADRVEICTALALGGLTPQQSLIDISKEAAGAMRRHVLIRPRQGDFLYSEDEIKVMLADIECDTMREADGYVTGILTADGKVDMRQTEILTKAIRRICGADKSLTFHRAFDMTADPWQALEDIIELGFGRILTSGCAPTAEQGAETLRRLHLQAAGRIRIMAGGGINAGNARKIMELTGITSLHASCSAPVISGMRYRNPHTNMGTQSDDEYRWATTSAAKVAEVRKAMSNMFTL